VIIVVPFCDSFAKCAHGMRFARTGSPFWNAASMTNDEMLRAIRSTFPTLDGWQARTSVLLIPDVGSDLAADDEEWPYVPASTLAKIGLSSAREHLHAVRKLIESKELFPAATSTLCRTALVGASCAVWMLEPDDRSERVRRWLSLAIEDFNRHIQYGNDVRELLPPDQIKPNADEDITRLELRQGQLLSLLEDLGGVYKINLTDVVIPAALQYAVPDDEAQGQMILGWRSMSGAAHALAWHFFGNAGTSAAEVDALGIGEITVGGDVERLLMDYFTAYRVALAGWDLLDKRCAVLA
jgi:hypothetical protein